MSYIEKDVKVLNKKLNEMNEELNILYRNIGNKLLSSLQEGDALPLLEVNATASSEYAELLHNREIATGTILEIKTSYERLSELSKFKKQIQKSIRDSGDSLLKLKNRFALAFYKGFKNNKDFLSLEGYEDVEKYEEEIAEILKANEEFLEDKKEAGFLAKFNLNRKIASNKLKISLIKKSIEKNISNRSEQIFNFPCIKDLYDSAQMEDDLRELYEKINESTLAKDELESRILDIKEEEEFLLEKMHDICEGCTHSKQITILNDEVKKIDERIDELLKSIAVEFVSFFIEKDEVLPEDEMKDASLYKEYKYEIKEVANLKKQITIANLNIEYCNVALQKEAIVEKIDSMNRTVEVCEEGIKSYQRRIASLKENIENYGAEKLTLIEKLSSLEKAIKEKM